MKQGLGGPPTCLPLCPRPPSLFISPADAGREVAETCGTDRERGGGYKGGRVPGDHVSGSDLHYGTIERPLFPPGGGEEDWCVIFLSVPVLSRFLRGQQR